MTGIHTNAAISGATRRPKKKTPSLAAEFGARLRRFRELRGLTQQQFAHWLKAAKSRISRYESGNTLPETETLVILGEVLEVSIALRGPSLHSPIDSGAAAVRSVGWWRT